LIVSSLLQDINKNGHIQYTEFLAATLEAHGYIEEARIAEAFDRLDADNTGFISKDDLKELLGKEYTKDLAHELIRDADDNNDGKISFQEFLYFFRRQTKAIAAKVAASPEASEEMGDETSLLGLDARIPGGQYDTAYDMGKMAEI
jgi:EF-hand domain pair